MPLPQGLRPEAEPPRRTRREVLDEDVGLFDDVVQYLFGPVLLEVKGHGLLGTVEPDEVAGETLYGPVISAREVTDLRAFDLDHPRAQVRELAGSEWRCHRLLQGDDRYAFERQHQNDLGRPRTCSAT